jgi:hypothetical protein
MYNTKVVCTYHTQDVFLETDQISEGEKEFIRNVLYRQELLDIFEKDDFNECEISKSVNELYKELIDCKELQECMRNVVDKFISQEDSEEFGLFILFSYDYMHLTHLCVSEFLENKKMSNENISNLMKAILEQ